MRFFPAALLLIFPLMPVIQGNALAQPASENTIQALLAEVRQLRLALERSAVVVPQMQLTMQRLQLQQQTVARASADLTKVSEQLAKAATEQSSLTSELKSIEAMASGSQDASRRQELERQIAAVKAEIAQRVIVASETRAREAEAAGRLRAEEAKVGELSERLNTLERALTPPQQR